MKVSRSHRFWQVITGSLMIHFYDSFSEWPTCSARENCACRLFSFSFLLSSTFLARSWISTALLFALASSLRSSAILVQLFASMIDGYLWTFSCEMKSSSHLFSSVHKSASARFLLLIASNIGLSEWTDRVRLPADDLMFFSDIGLGGNDRTGDLQVWAISGNAQMRFQN